MTFAGSIFPKFDTRLDRSAALEHPTFMTAVLALWDKGLDTSEISRALFEHEHVVAFVLRIGREERRERSLFNTQQAPAAQG